MEGKSKDQTLASTCASEVGVVAFTSKLPTSANAQIDASLLQCDAIGLREQRRGFRAGRKNRFVHAQHNAELDLRVARAINCANENLIERRGDDANCEVCQTGVEDWQPFAQRNT